MKKIFTHNKRQAKSNCDKYVGVSEKSYKKMRHSTSIAITIGFVAVAVTVILMRFQLTKAMAPSEQYVSNGRYYITGTVVTDDGNEWAYTTNTISDKKAYDSEPVYVIMDDNGTEDITDDIILGIVKDVNTAVYDTLENELSASFELERNGNNIRLKAHK